MKSGIEIERERGRRSRERVRKERREERNKNQDMNDNNKMLAIDTVFHNYSLIGGNEGSSAFFLLQVLSLSLCPSFYLPLISVSTLNLDTKIYILHSCIMIPSHTEWKTTF